ncbi:unnamed protein product [Pelagomonas calceolata]|uniref:Solute carrier family 5 member 8 n=1 Tax=Pelagomonas calceolata TaxID=35677 RepID=A0A8J2SJX5_9STRA|nr:unnamed protein product [Pelagomonas calceolata]
MARVALLLAFGARASAKCLSSDALEHEFLGITGLEFMPSEGSCCQFDVCGLPCAQPHDPKNAPKFYGRSVAMAVAAFCAIGLVASYYVGGDTAKFFVAGRTLPLPIVVMTLASQCIDANAVLGNADLSYWYHFYDGAVLPIGLGLSLILNGLFLAKPINEMKLLTLPDLYARKYGRLTEVLGSLICTASFIALLAGNLVGCGKILAYLYPTVPLKAGIVTSGLVMLLYTAAGGLVSVAYSDCAQAMFGLLGVAVCALWAAHHGNKAPPDSIGFPGYTYPDTFGQRVCDKYDGVPCENDAAKCCYNTEKWCPSDDNCRADNGAYWWKGGDARIFDSVNEQGGNQMLNPHSLTPFPNAILFNWATVFILAFGNLAALDFQARCMAAKTAKIAQIGCLMAGILGIMVATPFALMGGVARYYYGPDSMHAEFEADTCHRAIDFPTCAQWIPDKQAVLRVLTKVAPNVIGAWTLIGIVAASMSTSDGAILAMSTVASHNLFANLPRFLPKHFDADLVTTKNKLTLTRFFGIPCTVAAILIACYKADTTGYLLVVAFDIVLAGCVVPIFGACYCKTPSPTAGLAAMVGGSLLRIILEFSLPKDGMLIAPFGGDEFLDYGRPKSSLYPTFFDVPEADKWSRDSDQCEQSRLEDWTGLDSMLAPAFSLVCFLVVHFLEKFGGVTLVSSWLVKPVPEELDDDFLPKKADESIPEPPSTPVKPKAPAVLPKADEEAAAEPVHKAVDEESAEGRGCAVA